MVIRQIGADDSRHPGTATLCADDRRLDLPDHHQHAALRLRHVAAVFFIKQGLSVANSFSYSLLMALGAPVGSASRLDRRHWGRKPTIIGASLVSVCLASSIR